MVSSRRPSLILAVVLSSLVALCVPQAHAVLGDCNCSGGLDAGDPVCTVLRLVGGYSETCPAVCGNDVVEPGESCDGTDGGECSTSSCEADCTCTCGNGVCDAGENDFICNADCGCMEPADCGCPEGSWDRTPTEVVNDVLAAFSANDQALMACNYYENAFIIDDQGVLVGHTDILAAYASLYDLFDGISHQVLQTDEFEDTVRLLFSLDAGWVELPDGVNTYDIENGRIRWQTRHGLIVFNGPPPDQQ